MTATLPAPVNGRILAWAREQAGYSLDEVGEKVKQSGDRIRRWEVGEERPTYRMAEGLAKAYQRSLPVFFLEAPPPTAPLATEYRRLPGVEPGQESPELRFALRDLQHKREVAIGIAEDLGDPLPTLRLSARLSEPPESVGIRLRDALGVSVETQLGWDTATEALQAWRDSVEGLGTLVFQFYRVPEKIRGASLLVFPTPVIGLNNKDLTESKSFTLLHELTHLLLAASRDERPAQEETRTPSEWKQLELWAEHAAGAALMPGETLRRDKLVQEPPAAAPWGLDHIRRLARRYHVTPSAMATRLWKLDVLSGPGYQDWRTAWDAYTATLAPRPGFGRSTQAGKSLNRNGSTFTSLVLQGMNERVVSMVDAYHHLGLKSKHQESLIQELAGWGSRPREPA